jgi:hypothetical protein
VYAAKKLALAFAVTVAIPMLASSSPAMAAGVTVGCDAGTLSGTYTYAYTGFNIVAGAPVAFSTAGYASYHGNGTLTGSETTTTTVKGKVVVSPGTYTGTYVITANCSIKEIDKDQANALTHYDEFTGPSGNTINFVETDPGIVTSAIETRD